MIDNGHISQEFSFNFDTKFTDIGMSSLNTVQFILDLEEEYEVNLPDDEVERALTVGEICWVVIKALELEE